MYRRIANVSTEHDMRQLQAEAFKACKVFCDACAVKVLASRVGKGTMLSNSKKLHVI